MITCMISVPVSSVPTPAAPAEVVTPASASSDGEQHTSPTHTLLFNLAIFTSHLITSV